MSLCKTCQSLPIVSLPPLPPTCNAYPVGNGSPDLVWVGRRSSKTSPADETAEPLGLPFHQSLEALREAAPTCAICSVVASQVSRFQTAFAEKGQDDYRQKEGPGWEMYVAKGKNQDSGFMVVAKDQGRGTCVWVLAAVGVCCGDGDALGSVVRGRRIKMKPAGQFTVRRVLRWINKEDEESGWADTVLPEIILDLGESTESRVSLYTPRNLRGKYAVLSYAPDATVVEKFDGTAGYIDPDGLPRAFQDAIKITRKLRLRYLWIDVLCSSQFDSSNSHRSMPGYASVFSNAYITLSTLSSSSASDSFLALRDIPTDNLFQYTHNNRTGTLYASTLPKEPTLYPSNYMIMSKEPLSQHSWALQDRLFSPRILHFGSTQLYFESSTHFLGEDGFKMPGRDDALTGEPARVWHNTLQLYCKRNLPRAGDKLPALSNIARHIASQSNDTYVAGLWRSNLIEGLTWQATGYAKGRTSEPSAYRAPSWSWASIDGPFGTFSVKADDFSEVAEILDCHVTLKTDDVYGEVSDAWIKMRAPLEPLYPTEEVPRKQVWRMKTKTGDEGGAVCIFDTSSRAERARGVPVYVVLLTKGGSCCGQSCVGSESPYYHGIIVVKVEGKEGVYERVGKVMPDDEVLGECGDERDMVEIILV
ncbi:hypothetical protein HBI81_020610 [Parastagonospora nodorum]|nr:hypothetical protein HBH52_166490 [Parastagonospora nodorum]KAH5016909.1 hypothetical protein HBI74_169230 [Parastagonospora nodorum]KAH6544271.1 hypothetical protein HBI81_020610 [Parastagonospora nodorum]